MEQTMGRAVIFGVASGLFVAVAANLTAGTAKR
jgi:hypothetical protein